MKRNLIEWFSLLALLVIVGLISFTAGNKRNKNNEIKKEIKISEKKERNFKKQYDSISFLLEKLREEKQKIKVVYIKGKESIKHINNERILQYTDTLCKEDVISLKKHLKIADTLIYVQNKEIGNINNQLILGEKIIKEKESQIKSLKNIKNNKKFGIGIISGVGTDFSNGFKPFVGLGLSYNIINF